MKKRNQSLYDSLFEDGFDEFVEDEIDEEDSKNTDKDYSVEKVEAGLPLYVIHDASGSRIEKERRRRVLQSAVDKVQEIVRFSTISVLARDTEMAYIEYKDTRCKLVDTDSTAVVINGASELVCGIEYDSHHYCYSDEEKCYPLRVLFAVDEETYKMFDNYDSIREQHKVIVTYSNLTKPQREFFKKQYNRPVQKADRKENDYTPIRNLEALRLLFETCENTYSPAVRAKVKLLFSELDRGISSSDRHDIVCQLSHILCIDTQLYPYEPKTYDQIMECFDKHIYGMTELKERIAEYIIAMQYSGSANFEILLVGPPGVGKTSIGEAVAEVYNNPYVHIDCAGANSISMGGLVKSYGGARAGKCVQGLYAKGRSDVTMMFDEIDKLNTKEGDPYSVLIKAIGPQKMLYDEYVDQDIDVSATKIICTANQPELLPDYILNRFGDNIFYIDAYSHDEKVAIAQKHLVRKKLSRYNINEDEIIFEKSALEVIAKDYCEDEGAREMASYVESLIRKVIVRWSRGISEKPFVIDEAFVRENLTKMSLEGKDKNLRKIGFGA